MLIFRRLSMALCLCVYVYVFMFMLWQFMFSFCQNMELLHDSLLFPHLQVRLRNLVIDFQLFVTEFISWSFKRRFIPIISYKTMVLCEEGAHIVVWNVSGHWLVLRTCPLISPGTIRFNVNLHDLTQFIIGSFGTTLFNFKCGVLK